LQKPYIQKNIKTNRLAGSIFIGLAFSLFCLFVGLSIGTIHIKIDEIMTLFFHGFGNGDSLSIKEKGLQTILWEVRLPRVVLSFLVGASLSIAGLTFQGLLRNPLADPYTIGVSSGAALGAVSVLFFHIEIGFLGAFTLPIVSILAAFVTLFCVLGFTNLVDRRISSETIILTGIIISSFLGSILTLIIALSGDELRQVINWLIGSVSMRGWSYVHLIFPFFLISFIVIWWNSFELNAFAMGETTAKNIGVNTKIRKMMLLVAASSLTGASVAVSGTIGFVGLVIPHMLRLWIGADHRRLIPLSVLYGGSFLVIADLLSRTIIEPRELPIGVLTSFIGAPIFTYIFFKRRRGV
jgi:iron complex transport system permease protein